MTILVYDLPNRDGNAVRKIWADNKLIYQFMTFLTGMETGVSIWGKIWTEWFMTFLTGMETIHIRSIAGL